MFDNRETRQIYFALRPHIAYPMRLVKVYTNDREQNVVMLRSVRKYDGDYFAWSVPIDTTELAKDARRVARMITTEAAEDMERAQPERVA